VFATTGRDPVAELAMATFHSHAPDRLVAMGRPLRRYNNETGKYVQTFDIPQVPCPLCPCVLSFIER
jgi:hypothetical protein